MRLWRKKPKPAPLLSDAEMKRLHEEIFEEPVSVERIFDIYGSVPKDVWDRGCEWVMDRRMFLRIRLLTTPSGFAYFAPLEATAAVAFTLLGLPIRVEPFAKLAIRERVSA